MSSVRAHLIITGRVQGVCYRVQTQEEAVRRRLSGWIRNLPTGQVEAVFEGDQKTIEEMVAWCHKGPAGARVTEIQVDWQELRHEFDDFRIIH
ncbi:MAG: acylphosphatase [bacterium]|nr:acylphosphatase [bacterium]